MKAIRASIRYGQTFITNKFSCHDLEAGWWPKYHATYSISPLKHSKFPGSCVCFLNL